MTGVSRAKGGTRLSTEAAGAIRAAIFLAGGREVCCVGTLNVEGEVSSARVVARGGASSVLATTLEKVRSRESSVALLPPRSDIDLAEDLDRFAADSTRGALHELLKVR